MARCVLDNLVEAGSFSEEKLSEVNAISDMYSYAPIKSALNFGYLVRKTYLSYLDQNGYPLVDVRNEVLDESFVEQCDIKHLNSFLYLPLRKDTDGSLLVAAADPLDEKLLNTLYVKFRVPIKTVAASDLDIIWMAHKLRGQFYVKEAVFSLMRKDPASSGLVTFTNGQLITIFVGLAILISLLMLYFTATAIVLNLLSSVFFFICNSF
jgi:hypothetical protein